MCWLAKAAIVASMGLFLVGCGPVYETRYHYKAPKSMAGRRCVVSCQSNRLQCEANLQRRHDRCEAREDADARAEYQAYARQRRNNHLAVDKVVRDFKSSWRCSVAGDCSSGYRECYRTCGGRVSAYQVCTAFCGQKSE
jgi:hypothetical protein